MRRHKFIRKSIIGMGALLGGGLVLQNNCLNTALSIPVCGSVLAFCTPTDQANLIFPYLTLPDYNADPSCTIPLGCGGRGGSDLFDGEGFGGPGGGPSDPPEDNGGGGGGGGV